MPLTFSMSPRGVRAVLGVHQLETFYLFNSFSPAPCSNLFCARACEP